MFFVCAFLFPFGLKLCYGIMLMLQPDYNVKDAILFTYLVWPGLIQWPNTHKVRVDGSSLNYYYHK